MRIELTGRLDPCFLLSYMLPAHRLRPLVPAELELETVADFGFANLVISRIATLRPNSFPSFVGLTYWHVALRIHARAIIQTGHQLSGLYFVQSFVSSCLVALVGNWLTGFKMAPAHFETSLGGTDFEVLIKDCAGLRISRGGRDSFSSSAPPPFQSREHMDRVLRYSPLSLDVMRGGRTVSIAEVERDPQEWSETAVKVVRPTGPIWTCNCSPMRNLCGPQVSLRLSIAGGWVELRILTRTVSSAGRTAWTTR